MIGYAYSFDKYHWSLPEFGKTDNAAIKRILESARSEAEGEETVYIARCTEVKPGPEDFSIESLMEEISNNFSERSRIEDIDLGIYFTKEQWEKLGRAVWEAIEKSLKEDGELDPHYYRVEDEMPYDLATGKRTIRV